MTAPPRRVPLWTPWGKGFKSVDLPSALGPPSVQRPALGFYTTSRDANCAATPLITHGRFPCTRASQRLWLAETETAARRWAARLRLDLASGACAKLCA